MSTHRLHTETREIYFCTITCYKWLPLFEESDGYDSVYTWFDHLNKNGCLVLAYVIMPNHLHVLLYPTNPNLSLNKLVANGKRFMAYDIVSRLTSLKKTNLLQQLKEGVQKSEANKGKKHQVFRLSFDARKCFNMEMLEQKLDYIHHNPVNGKWHLVEDFRKYEHSSASFYEENKDVRFSVMHYKDIE
jgi:REP element-mobilizing transposase RayT